ncbi:unnamed protein product [Calypogeia fissa]
MIVLKESFPNFLRSMRMEIQIKPQPLKSLLHGWYTSDPVYEFSMKATDPRDLVFALINLSSDAGELGIVPDYTKTPQEVFIDAAKALLRPGDLSLLLSSQFPKCLSGLPSWVPDWSSHLIYGVQDSSQDPGIKLSTDDLMLKYQVADNDFRSFSASGDMVAPIAIQCVSDGSVVLSVKGIIIDTVSDTASMWQICGSTFLRFLDWIDEITDLLEHAEKNVYGSAEGLKDAVWRTTITDWECLPSREYCRVRQSYLQLAQDKVDKLLYGDKISESQEEDYSIGIHNYLVSLNTLAIGRRPFVTNQRYVGQGTPLIQVGDIVAVLIGSKAPFIVRIDEENHYQLVGEAYVHGIIDGEAIRSKFDIVNIDLY